MHSNMPAATSYFLTLLPLISLVHTQTTATLSIQKPYNTSYYGDTFMFVCTMTLDKSRRHIYEGVEFVMEQPFSFLTSDYGNVCYNSGSYTWPGLSPSASQCSPTIQNNSRVVSIAVQLTEEMHDPGSYINDIKYKCALIYNAPGFFGGIYREVSAAIPLPIKKIRQQTIQLEAPNVVRAEEVITSVCISSNPIAHMSIEAVPSEPSRLLVLNSSKSSRGSELTVQITVSELTSAVACSDGGRLFLGKTYIEQYVRNTHLRTVINPTFSLESATSTVPSSFPATTQLTIGVKRIVTEFHPRAGVFIGQNLTVTCSAKFYNPPQTIERMVLTRRTPQHPQQANYSTKCPPVGIQLFGDDYHLEGTINCSNIRRAIDYGSSQSDYSMTVELPTSEELTRTRYQYSCSIEFNRRGSGVFDEWREQPAVYELPDFPPHSISPRVLLGADYNVTCRYNSDNLPPSHGISFAIISLQDRNETILNRSRLISDSSLELRASLKTVMRSFTINCSLLDVPAGAQVPAAVTQFVHLLYPGLPQTTRTLTRDGEGTTVAGDSRIAGIFMSLTSEEATNDSYIIYDKTATFRCQVNLTTPYTTSGIYDGITLQVTTQYREIYEDGCLTYTVLKSNKKFFKMQTSYCPTHESSLMVYEALVRFTVGVELVGQNTYQCLFRTRSYNFISGYYPVISARSQQKVILGVSFPTMVISPTVIVGFVGQAIGVNCSSIGGFPDGTPQLEADNKTFQNKVSEQSPENILKQVIVLNKRINGTKVTCKNSAFEGVQASADVFVRYIKTVYTKRSIKGINHNFKLDCSKALNTSGNILYSWNGTLVASTQKYKKIIDINYSAARKGHTFITTCNVRLQGDTIINTISIEYALSFVEAQTPVDKGTSNSSKIATIIVIVALILSMAGFMTLALGRELTSRKINRRLHSMKARFFPAPEIKRSRTRHGHPGRRGKLPTPPQPDAE